MTRYSALQIRVPCKFIILKGLYEYLTFLSPLDRQAAVKLDYLVIKRTANHTQDQEFKNVGIHRKKMFLCIHKVDSISLQRNIF